MPILALQTNNGELVRMGMQDLTAEIPQIGRNQIYKTAQRIRSRMGKPGKKITYPVRWDSKKQRRAFFASEGFGRGIPTERSGAYEEAWEIIKLDNGYAVSNPLEYAKYVGGGPFGGSQSNIHQDRWERFRDVVEEETDKLPDEITAEIDIVARRSLP